MSEETIFDSNDNEKNPLNQGQNTIEEINQPDETAQQEPKLDNKKKNVVKSAVAAGIGGAVGAGLGVLMPKMVFPSNLDEGEAVSEEENEEVEAPTASGHLTGHDMDVATGVDDSMSFNEAFAAARHEVGPGGLFVWHGNTYGTYYGNEWNAMTPEEREQYWADVYHTTSNLNETEQEPTDEPILGSNEPLEDPNPLVEDQETLGDQGEGNLDDEVLLVDPNPDPTDDEAEAVFIDEPMVIIIDEPEPLDMDDDGVDILDPTNDIDMTITDDGIASENPDVDELASIDFDPDITIDNDMNMDDFV